MSQRVRIPVDYPRILLAEDDQEMRSLIAWTLHKVGYQIIECRNGFEFYQRLREVSENLPPKDYDLLIADIRMPGLDAFEVLEDMKSRIECPPVILITSFGDDETHSRAKKLGAAAMFDKPFDMDDLVRKVRELAPHKHIPAEQHAASKGSTAPNPHTD